MPHFDVLREVVGQLMHHASARVELKVAYKERLLPRRPLLAALDAVFDGLLAGDGLLDRLGERFGEADERGGI